MDNPWNDGIAFATISKLVLAVLGIARHGPIARYIATVKACANTGCTREESASSDAAFSIAIKERTGSPIAVIMKPRNALAVFPPAR